MFGKLGFGKLSFGILSLTRDVLPKVIQNSLPKTSTDDVKKAVNSILFNEIVKKQLKQPVVDPTPELQFVITGVPEENITFFTAN